MSASLYSLNCLRERGVVTEPVYWKAVRDSEYLLKRLQRTHLLEGHTGCVNTIAWNDSGSSLVSGADDCRLHIYSTARGKVARSIHSSHHSNIFSAKFLPLSNDCRLVSCAGTGSVEYSELTPVGGYTPHPFKCQTSVTYQVATLPDCSEAFLTCEEKGYIRLFDLRTASSCICEGCRKAVLYKFPVPVTSIAVHPLSPHYLAFGLGDGSVRLLDRRMADRIVGKITPSRLAERILHSKYTVDNGEHLKKITCVQFNATGCELLTSYSEEYLYLFKSCLLDGASPLNSTLSPPQYLSQFQHYHPGGSSRNSTHFDKVKSKKKIYSTIGQTNKPESFSRSSSQSSQSPPPVKKLRLRGDWSDTGPEAQPDRGQFDEARGRGGGERRRSNVMNQITRMFAEWIDMLNPPDQHPGGATGLTGEGEGRGGEEGEGEESGAGEGGEPNGDSVGGEAGVQSDGRATQQHETDGIESTQRDTNVSVDHKLQVGGTEASANKPSSLPATASAGSLSLAPALRQSTGTTTATAASHLLETTPFHAHLRPVHTAPSHPPIQPTALNNDNSVVLKPVATSEERYQQASPEISRAPDVKPVATSEELYQQASPEISRAPDPPVNSAAAPPVTVTQRAHQSSSSQSYGTGSLSTAAAAAVGAYCYYGGVESSGVGHSRARASSHPLIHPVMVYKGHRNSRTMIKQANFWGDQWVLSGSDCGRVFLWDKWSGEIVSFLVADSHVVNCVQPHPISYMLATSGIDYDIKLWEPVSEAPCTLDNIQKIVDTNERMLADSRNTITVPSMVVLRVLTYLHRRRRLRERREQAQNSSESDDDTDDDNS